MTVVSVGYRLAPANPYPAAVHDCIDTFDYLTSLEGRQRFGDNEVKVIGGESAGAHLAVLTALHFAKDKPQDAAKLAGLVLLYGTYDLTLSTPSLANSPAGSAAMIDREIMAGCVDGFLLPERTTIEQRRAPEVSPLFEDLSAVAARLPGRKLPPALFICGTGDPLLDDTVMMSAKWMATGSDVVAKIYPGAPHGFDLFTDAVDEAMESKEVIYQFLRDRA